MSSVLLAPLVMSLALAGIMGYLGIHVLKREIIFIDIALAQFAAVGAIGAHVVLHAHDDSLLGFAVSLLVVLVAAAFYAFVRGRTREIPVEAVIGVSYAVAAAGALFLVGVAPGGHVHVQGMLAGSILWVTWRQLLTAVAAFAAVGLLFRVFDAPLTRVSEDYDGAARAGVRVAWWDFLFYALCGVVICVAVRVSGVVLVFAFLIIPATTSALFASAWRSRLIIAWAVGAGASLLGIVFATHLDFSVGPSIALFLGLALAVAAAWKRFRYGTYVTSIVLGATAVFLAVVFGIASLLASREAPSAPDAAEAPPVARNARPHIAASDSDAAAAPTSSDPWIAKLHEATDDAAKSDVVIEALREDRARAVRVTLHYLRSDPPVFFRQSVIDALDEVTGAPSGFDAMQPFDAPVNRAAAARLTGGAAPPKASGTDGG